MWYGSVVLRHGRSRPCRRYQERRRRRNRRRSGADGMNGGGVGCFFSRRLAGISYNSAVKIYTRTGDTGETSLFDGTRVRKDDARVDAYGEVDELNAWLGVARGTLDEPTLDAALIQIQKDLFALGAQLADPAEKIARRVTKATVGDADVARLEQLIDQLDAQLPPLRKFILPGGSPAGSALHVARTICRRAERRLVSLQPAVDPVLLRYVNRLADLLFVIARAANQRAGSSEIEW
jgi:cob(I)alamin adenosyltransferase